MEVGSNLVATESELRHLGIDISTLEKNLTLPNPEYVNKKRFGKGKIYGHIEPYICYLKKVGSSYIVPRYYIGELGKYGNEGRDVKIHFKFKLRDYQQKFWDNNSSAFEESTGILLEAACGTGKTIMAIYFSMIRGKQTMVLVPTYYLAKQWKQRIEESTDSTCIIVSSKDTEIRVDSDFTIIVLDLFTCRKLPVELIHNVGHVILDEAHRVGAEMYLPILDEVPAIYRTALTATFRRTDGVHKILKYHFGECIQMKSHFPRPLVYSVKTNVQIRSILSKNKKYEHFVDFLDRNNVPYSETKSAIEFPSLDLRDVAEKEYKKGVLTKTAFHEIASCLKRSSEMPYSVVDSYLNEHSGRRKIAIRVIQECLDSGRSVLFLSKRKSTLKDLHKYFAAYKPMLIISETNSRSPEDENYLQNACPLIFGISQLAKEGLDIDRLDTLIIHLPMKDTEQAIGRINRLYEGKKFPVCLYLLDNCPITFAVFRNAQKFISINADYKGERTLLTLKSAL